MRAFLIMLVIIFGLFAGTAHAEGRKEQGKIDYLLNAVATSDLVFIRNGTNYSGKDARDHLQHKLDYFGDKIQTADQFIIYIASSSLISHTPYLVQLPDGKKETAAQWLREQLAKQK